MPMGILVKSPKSRPLRTRVSILLLWGGEGGQAPMKIQPTLATSHQKNPNQYSDLILRDRNEQISTTYAKVLIPNEAAGFAYFVLSL